MTPTLRGNDMYEMNALGAFIHSIRFAALRLHKDRERRKQERASLQACGGLRPFDPDRWERGKMRELSIRAAFGLMGV